MKNLMNHFSVSSMCAYLQLSSSNTVLRAGAGCRRQILRWLLDNSPEDLSVCEEMKLFSLL